MMSKLYQQKYRTEWESVADFKGWLKPFEGDGSRAYCAYCKADFYAKLSDIKKHATTKKHLEKAKPYGPKQQTIPMMTIKVDAAKKAEATMAMFIASHCSMLSMDHLGEACKAVFADSGAAPQFKMHRTKCREMITGILGPHFLKSLITDIGDNKYSLLLDESTDVSVAKYLGVVVRYFSHAKAKVVSTYLGLLELGGGDARAIVTALMGFLEKSGMRKENLIGIGTDNASVMTGINNGVHKILREEFGLTNLVLIRCVCHSLQLAVSHASRDTIPRCVEYLVRETYNWFSISPKRREAYQVLYGTINIGEKPLLITQVCATRWLSIEPAVERILAQWEELKLHFSLAKGTENCYMAETLHAMYADPVNLLYLTFLRSVLSEVRGAVKAFESEQGDPLMLLQTLTRLIESVAMRVLNPMARVNVLEESIDSFLSPKPYLGYLFESKVEELKIPSQDEENVRTRCVRYIMSLLTELKARLPSNFAALRQMANFSVSETLKQSKGNEIVEVFKMLGYSDLDTDRAMQQWRTIHLQKWDAKTTMEFWYEVWQYRDAAGLNPFSELGSAAISVLSLPHSNAEVERLFSQMSVVKSKLRNRMCLTTLSAILQVRYGLRLAGNCCCSHTLPDRVLQQFGSTAGYSFHSQAKQVTPSASVEERGHGEDEDDAAISALLAL